MCTDPKGGSSHREIRIWISRIRRAANLEARGMHLTKEGAEELFEIATKAERLLQRIEARDTIAAS